ncbi:hypothetical protein ACMD2_20954 [Ananas comosus]|uniref:Uncharacterized protein n=1 Tax=Ananas comosus TaxID=4615 RepID=A0A199UPP7_ANACO|nr:hypothetical protein ACMD2_20954 [Ananas comosus]
MAALMFGVAESTSRNWNFEQIEVIKLGFQLKEIGKIRSEAAIASLHPSGVAPVPWRASPPTAVASVRRRLGAPPLPLLHPAAS